MDYVLPDYTLVKRYVRTPDQPANKQQQVIRMNSERFSVPEVLFRPSDIGIEQIGLAEAINHVISLTDPAMQPHFTSNIILTGGNSLFPGFKQRVFDDVRSSTDIFFDVKVHLPSNPITYAWEGGSTLAASSQFQKVAVSREAYNEHGANVFLENKHEIL
ncbi:hypothetical protein EB796_005460 [Bugula neritina]|uniref:ARP6 n=1 Tax=Bugula neritina TaxID=10212 RepID=A0A7J7KC65_BUGNE|nr:hypothetical protein EB796_005460 [Bugula neritina]